MNNLRRVARLQNNVWVDCQFIDLRTGDIFRMWDPDGTPVIDHQEHQGHSVDVGAWRCLNDAKSYDEGVRVDPVFKSNLTHVEYVLG